LTPLGKASKNWQTIGYSPEDFLEFYRQILDALIDLNLKNINIRESTASMLLQRISGESINYMELRSPCGAGIGQIAYYADGRIFTCDEGRMLAEMGDDSFQLGNTDTSIYKGLVAHPACKAACQASVLESIPSCCDCVYQPYCGVCPVVNFALQKDIIERSPNGYRCQINKGILDILFEKIRYGRKEEQEVLNSWRG
jgi:radical SAM protein with 4Fe4S-binding SPASM domain